MKSRNGRDIDNLSLNIDVGLLSVEDCERYKSSSRYINCNEHIYNGILNFLEFRYNRPEIVSYLMAVLEFGLGSLILEYGIRTYIGLYHRVFCIIGILVLFLSAVTLIARIVDTLETKLPLQNVNIYYNSECVVVDGNTIETGGIYVSSKEKINPESNYISVYVEVPDVYFKTVFVFRTTEEDCS